MDKRTGAWLAAGLIMSLIPTAPASAAPAVPATEAGPPVVTPADIRFAQHKLRHGDARQVGLIPEQVDRMRTEAAAYLVPTPDHPNFPTYSGAVVLATKDGVVVQHAAVGTAVRHSAPGVELPAAEQIPARNDTLFDLASVSKLFTTITVMQLVERGLADLDEPVATYVPEFAAGGKQTVTLRMLLTHTSGLPAWAPLWSAHPTPAARIAAALATPLTAAPLTRYVYSDLGLIALGVLVERLTGQPLGAVIRDRITAPLGMGDTMFNPPASLRSRIAATEYEPYAGRGMVWGEVHDENAWGLGGVAGHAGLFSTAGDLAILCQMLLNGGQYRGVRILGEDTIRAMLVNYNAGLESTYPESDRGLGFELNKHWYMMGLSSPIAFGHTGFTGTSIVIDPLAHSFVILLSNRVHPDRAWGSNNVARRAVAGAFAEADPVRPLSGAAWRADPRDSSAVTLTAPLRRGTSGGKADFMLWYDTEPGFDRMRFETSADGGVTWSPSAMTLTAGHRRWTALGEVTGYGGRQWWRASVDLPAGTTHLRWRNSTDGSARGRGVYVDKIHAVDGRGLLFSGDGPDAARLVASGWTEVRT